MLAIVHQAWLRRSEVLQRRAQGQPQAPSRLRRRAARRLPRLHRADAAPPAGALRHACPKPSSKSSPCPTTWPPTSPRPSTTRARPTATVPARSTSTPTTGPTARWPTSRPSPTTRASPATTCRSPSQQELTGLPAFRQQTYYTAYTEGWALYCGAPGQGDRLLPGPLLRLRPPGGRHVARDPPRGGHRRPLPALDAPADGRLLPRALRPRRDQRPVRGATATSRGPRRRSATRWASSRSWNCATAPRSALGPKFDLRAFHDVVLDSGALPLDVLEAQVNAWIQSQLPAQKPAP